jgi:hypothetical protein
MIPTRPARCSPKPGEGAEIKLQMTKGSKANYTWTVDGGVVNFDMHGDGGGRELSYLKRRAAPDGKGVIEAALDGYHGWFWRQSRQGARHGEAAGYR